MVFMLWTMRCTGTPAAENVPGDSMALWLRADRAGKVDENAGVRVWENRAAAAIGHAVQDEVVRRPRRIPSVASLGGQPALEFDGKDDFLHLPWLRIGSQTTVILVAEPMIPYSPLQCAFAQYIGQRASPLLVEMSYFFSQSLLET